MLNRITHNTILELNMDRPPVNALNGDLVNALHQQIDAACADGFEAIILSGQANIYSAGLDVPELMNLDRSQLKDFWLQLMSLLGCIAACPIPIVAAITGHSPAGGTVITLPCDYRIMGRGSEKGAYKIGLNEVQVGLVVPAVIYQSLVRLIGERTASQLTVEGLLIDSEAALACGMVDELQDTKDVVAAALDWCLRHLALPRKAMLKTRAMTRKAMIELYSKTGTLGVDGFVEHWFDDSTQTVLQGLVDRLGKR